MPIYSFSNGVRRVNLLFVHVPKTGGTAISHFFKNIGFTEHFGTENQAVRATMVCPPQHYDYDILSRIINLDVLELSCAIVRHPLTRIVSGYKWAMTKSTMAIQNMTFSEWIDVCFRSYEKNEYFLANHIKPQFKFIGPKIRRVFKYEEGLDHIVAEVLADTGVRLSAIVSVPKINASSYPDVVISKGDEERIRRFYANDFKLYNYD